MMLSFIDEAKRLRVDSFLRDKDNAFECLKRTQKRVDDCVARILPYLKDSTIDQGAYVKLLTKRRALVEKIQTCKLQKDEDLLKEKLEKNTQRLEKDFSSLREWTPSAKRSEEITISVNEEHLIESALDRLESAQEDANKLEEALRPGREEIKKLEGRLAKWKALPTWKRMITKA